MGTLSSIGNAVTSNQSLEVTQLADASSAPQLKRSRVKKEILREVINSLDLRYGERDDFVYATENSDVHYQFINEGERVKLRLVSGEGFPDENIIKRKEHWKRYWWLGILFPFCMLTMVNSFLSPLWYLWVFGAVIYLALPILEWRKIHRKIIPALKSKGIDVVYEGCFDVTHDDLEPVAGGDATR